MQYLILSDQHGVKVEHTVQTSPNHFSIVVAACSPLGACMLYDDDSGNNRLAHPVHILKTETRQPGKMRILLVLTGEEVHIDYHPILDA